MNRRNLALVVLALLALALPACSSAVITRVTTEPPGAKLVLVEKNLEYITPCDLYDADLGEEVTITKEGFQSYHGPIEELSQVAAGNYLLKLVRR